MPFHQVPHKSDAVFGRPGRTLVAFAVEDRADERAAVRARREMIRKIADFLVVNTPEAMSADVSLACILSRDGVALSWAGRRLFSVTR